MGSNSTPETERCQATASIDGTPSTANVPDKVKTQSSRSCRRINLCVGCSVVVAVAIGVFIGWFCASNGAAQSVEVPVTVQCQTLCRPLFIGHNGATYEHSCIEYCWAGANLTADEQCLYCAVTGIPMSGFNLACQRYVNLIANKGT